MSAVSAVISFVDPYADTQELPVFSGDSAASLSWEREQLATHLREQYQIVREIGRGGMGIVFLARDIALHRLVAIKVLREEFASSSEHRERFRREARMTARLSHPNIVPVPTFGETSAAAGTDAPFVYIIMKYGHGESLADRLRIEPQLPTEDARRILH